jgi:hypothetical protein
MNIYNLNANNSQRLAYEDHKGILKTDFAQITSEQIINNRNLNHKKLVLRFKTPFLMQKLVEPGKKSKEIKWLRDIDLITPQLLADYLERRNRHLAWLYCDSKFDKQKFDESDIKITKTKLYEFKSIRKKSEDNNNKEKYENYYGLVGDIVLEGNLSSILPLIYVGEQIHLGKKTSFGFGKYSIITM